MRIRTILSVGVVLWSTAVWVALMGEVSVANVLWGAVAGAALLRLVPVPTHPEATHVSPVGALRYLAYLAWALVRSSAYVAWEVVTPGSRIRLAIVPVPLRTTSDVVTTIVANSISLTPGTLTVEVRRDPNVLDVHVMHLDSIEGVRAEVAKLEDLALAALPGAEAAATRPDAPGLATEEVPL